LGLIFNRYYSPHPEPDVPTWVVKKCKHLTAGEEGNKVIPFSGGVLGLTQATDVIRKIMSKNIW
jgi:hypothetical protein